MSNRYDYGALYTDAILKEMQELKKEFGLSRRVLYRIRSFYNYSPNALGNSSRVIRFLSGLFEDYGFSSENFADYLHSNADLVCSNFVDLERKIVILNAQGLLDTVLFEKPFVLFSNNKLSALSLYAVGKNLQDEGIELTYESVYGPEYSNLQLQKLRKLYPLKVSKYDSLQKLFEKKRNQLRSENSYSMGYKFED